MFKEMAKMMPDEEVKLCMSILYEGSEVIKIVRYEVQNYIDVTFRVMGDPQRRVYTIALLPDAPDDIPRDIELRIDGEYLYTQYMIAKGYSEFWKGNIFI